MKLIKMLLPGILLLLSCHAFGQSHKGKVEFSTFSGAFMATANVVDESIPGIGTVVAKHQTALAFGGRLTYWLSDGIGIEGGLAYTGSDLKGREFQTSGSLNANLLYSSARVVLGYGKTNRLQLGAGFAFRTSSYDFVEGDTHATGVLSASLIFPLSKKLALRIDVEDYIHNVQWTLGNFLTQQIMQNDIVVGAGFSVSAGR